MADNVTTVVAEFVHRPQAMNIVFGIVMSTTAVVAFSGNLATILAILITEELMAQLPNYFTMSLAFTDFLTSIFVIVPSAISIVADGWILGKAMCDFHQFMNYYCIINTTQILALIALDRALCIKYPLHYPTKVSKNRVLAAVCFVMLSAIVVAGLPVLMDGNEFDYWEGACGLPWDSGKLLPTLYGHICYHWVCTLPQTVIITSTVIIVRSAKKSNKNMQSMASQKKENEDQEAKLIKSFLTLIVAFEMSLGVWCTLRMFKVLAPDYEIKPLWMSTVTTAQLYIGSAVNPFIYAILRKDFRNAFKRLFTGFKNRIFPF